jgi:hypothetical protein
MAPQVSTVAQVAKLSASKMLTTGRVGDQSEDASMAQARKILSKINALGFVTTDSQMGKKSEYDSIFEKGFVGVMWQRGYVTGFMSREKAHAFALGMDLVGGVAVDVRECAKKPPTDKERKSGYRIPVTRSSTKEGEFLLETHMPMMSLPFEYMWVNLLPETGLSSDKGAMRRVEPQVVQVDIVDMQWGRPMWLFKTVVEVLSGRGPTTPTSKVSRPIKTKPPHNSNWMQQSDQENLKRMILLMEKAKKAS